MDEYGSPTMCVYHSLRTKFGRFRRALYTRSTIPEVRMAIDTAIWPSLAQTVFVHPLYGCLQLPDHVWVPQTMYTTKVAQQSFVY